jgi:SAM-dependent methyltransferase
MNNPHEVREMMFGLGETFTYFQCSDCECLQILDAPGDMSKYYPSDYYSFSRGKKRLKLPGLKRSIKRLLNKYAVFNEGKIGKLLYGTFPEPSMRCLSRIPINRNMKILDIGSGDGAFLLDLADLGFTRLLGIDPYIEKDISINRSVTIHKQTAEDVSGKWDVILFHHSFEHCENPKITLSHVSSLLAREGTCIIRVPTASSFAWRFYGADWVQIDAPRHLFIPSLRTMELLGKEAGLHLFDIRYDSTAFQFWGSEQYRCDIPLFSNRSYLVNPRESMFRHTDIRLFKKWAQRLNIQKEGDQAAFYLRKQSI